MAKSKLDGEGCASCVAGAPTQFTIRAVDLFGNALQGTEEQVTAPEPQRTLCW